MAPWRTLAQIRSCALTTVWDGASWRLELMRGVGAGGVAPRPQPNRGRFTISFLASSGANCAMSPGLRLVGEVRDCKQLITRSSEKFACQRNGCSVTMTGELLQGNLLRGVQSNAIPGWKR